MSEQMTLILIVIVMVPATMLLKYFFNKNKDAPPGKDE